MPYSRVTEIKMVLVALDRIMGRMEKLVDAQPQADDSMQITHAIHSTKQAATQLSQAHHLAKARRVAR